jgi:hypothetical protein
MSAALWRSCHVAAAVLLVCIIATAARAQETSTSQPPAPSHENGAVELVKFLAGGLLGLGLHETGHLVFDELFAAQPHLKRVQFGPFPFFAVAHRSDLSPRREFMVSSAGFWVQEGIDEWLLTRRPALRDERAPLTKGLLAFNILNSIGYALVAFAQAGPAERDTRGMAASIHANEPVIGAIVMAPAILDSIRYVRRGSRWAAWTSRGVKVASVLLVIRG